MGGSTVIEGIDDRASMVETQKTFDLLGKLLGIHFQEIFFFSEMGKGGFWNIQNANSNYQNSLFHSLSIVVLICLQSAGLKQLAIGVNCYW